jgi:eukaryotic-like serine/threonine-protein kinase
VGEQAALVGAVLDGSYRVEKLLGEGGMGAVYHATQLRLDKPVAVKVMARELSAAAEAFARFRREALVTSNLGHPNIVQVFDFSTTTTGEPYLVMEFLDGEDLDHRLRRERRLSPSVALHIVKQVGAALMATHGKGIVHRDLKPANIYLLEAAGAGDFVKVLDFGISKVRSATTKLTRTSSIMGTPGYMSPEQAQGRVEDIDERTDQWALACITWECLAGEAPFQGESPLATLYQVVNQPPPSLVAKVPGLPARVEEVLLRALAKKKDDRFANVGDFVAALEAAVTRATVGVRASSAPAERGSVELRSEERPVSATTIGQTVGEMSQEIGTAPAHRRGWVWAVVGAAALLLIGLLALLRSGPAAQPVTATPAPIPVTAPAPTPAAAPIAAPPPAAVQDSPKPENPTPAASPSEDKARAAAPTAPERKRPRPLRRPATPKMIEDL